MPPRRPVRHGRRGLMQISTALACDLRAPDVSDSQQMDYVAEFVPRFHHQFDRINALQIEGRESRQLAHSAAAPKSCSFRTHDLVIDLVNCIS